MRHGFRLLFAAGIVALGHGTLADVPEAHVGDAELTLWVEAGAETLRLAHAHVDPQSVRLEWNGETRVVSDSLACDAAEGLLILPRPAAKAGEARVRYRHLPLDLPPSWSHRSLRPAGEAEPPEAVENRTMASSSSGTELHISGSKTFSVEVGSNQDLSLDQTLDLTITGRIASDVKVHAILTDRETPLQPEGTTRELEDLDQIFLRVEAPGAELDLGDVEVTESRLRLASFARQLEGATGRVNVGSLEGWGVGALTRGQFRQLEFFGEEGRQGPYRLLGAEEEGVVVAGSEAVSVDGVAMVRGETEDYVIDYSTGELTFTSRRVVTEQTEIAVDYEVSLEAYRRSLFGAAVRSREPGPGPALSVLFLRESDDRGQPLGLVISDSERRLLEDVGDGTDPGLDSGVLFVGPGMGDYEKVEADTLPVAIFRYAGPDSGSYDVNFIDVGAGLGSYADSTSGGRAVYYYVGDGEGRFKPGRPVPRPMALEIGDVALSWERGPLGLKAEGAFSRFDENTFSERGDGDNVDGAYFVSSRINSPTLSVGGRQVGRFEASLRARQVGSRYEAPGRLQTGFYEQDWNAPEGSLTGRERERGAALDFVSGERLRLGVDWETLNDWTGFGASRFGTRIQLEGPVRATGRLLRVSSEDADGSPGERGTEHLTVLARRGRGALEVAYTRERSERGREGEQAGSQFRDVDVTATQGNFERGVAFRTRVNFRRRWSVRAGADTRETDGLTTELEAGWARSAALRARASFVRRRLRSYGATPERTTHLGRLQLSQTLGEGVWNTQWRAEATSQAQRVRRQIITFVGENEGHYDALGRYVGVGDYEVFFQETQDEELQSVFDMTGRWTLAPGRGVSQEGEASAGARLWREAEWTAYLRARSESPGGLGEVLRVPSRWWGRNGDATDGTGEARTDIRLFTRSQSFSPTLRYEVRARTRRVGSASEELRDTESFQVQAVSSPRERLRLEGQQSWTTEVLTNRLLGDEQLEDEQRLRRNRSEVTAVYRISRPVRLRFQGARSAETLDQGSAGRTLWEATPGVVVNLTGGRAELRVRRIWESGETTATRIFDLDRPGWTTRMTADIRVQSSVDLNFWLEDRRPDAGAKSFTSRISLRAFF